METIRVEVCINSESEAAVREAVTAAFEGGASTVELCAAMELQGLTPPPRHVEIARAAFRDRPGLMVMIRPRGGDFVYTDEECVRMVAQIAEAADAGADGVVFGALHEGGRLDRRAMERLSEAAHARGMSTTFHRAFDALADPVAAADDLVQCGIGRVLTSGMPWGEAGTAVQGAPRIGQILRAAGGRLEVVIGGGVSPGNIRDILRRVPLDVGPVSVHAYSGVQEKGRTTAAAVRALVDAANQTVAQDATIGGLRL